MLPNGVSLGRMQGPLAALASISPHFTGAVRIGGTEGTGFVLVQGGTPCAAAFENAGEDLLLSGDKAYSHLLGLPSLTYELIAYTAEETEAARDTSREMGCLVSKDGARPTPPNGSGSVDGLEQVARQPGVIAVSVFHEGFALQSLGTADFEQVAAIAEDLLRAGTRITADMAMGDLSQMILETPAGKLIIAPHGDLSLCILAKPDANLGLIRLSIRGMQDGPA
ncbi:MULTISPECIES: roadblock/LC7 domain-containing protein [unclassified Methanoculleus]|uniref:roadblock/LC7 domain-containing protein n=1 Tax=unclassified Methanoculleus TaxID=2619537 RepID=UPI0025FBC4AD|nr:MULTISPECIES: roadblock/LC7 domain-containing protein [unclassified Methanoculleus]MCK9318080.1 roadblock/LC7 domain-containing protein [Methanoculleus sp.]MDD2253640.1 roadblock/LC7 domain-containing protein [Methanoculleus sp.]MDD2787727.1 roadblock/LC7 domain-containing protein [Methanoculleus sp.]MDD3216204.1 roadblock/LC7 domain-containing protein [Methanoculleus sp.]MDD4314127.1 roadblock/LC7 domain-containing protein [Methanoculleus sp.]